MKTILHLGEVDQQSLKSILRHEVPAPWPTQDQAAALRKVLSKIAKASSGSDLRDAIGLNDRVSLVSPTDPTDTFDFQIVMPAESDPDEDRVSVLLPVSLAAIGRRVGELVSWECPRGLRLMHVASVEKSGHLTV